MRSSRCVRVVLLVLLGVTACRSAPPPDDAADLAVASDGGPLIDGAVGGIDGAIVDGALPADASMALVLPSGWSSNPTPSFGSPFPHVAYVRGLVAHPTLADRLLITFDVGQFTALPVAAQYHADTGTTESQTLVVAAQPLTYTNVVGSFYTLDGAPHVLVYDGMTPTSKLYLATTGDSGAWTQLELTKPSFSFWPPASVIRGAAFTDKLGLWSNNGIFEVTTGGVASVSTWDLWNELGGMVRSVALRSGADTANRLYYVAAAGHVVRCASRSVSAAGTCEAAPTDQGFPAGFAPDSLLPSAGTTLYAWLRNATNALVFVRSTDGGDHFAAITPPTTAPVRYAASRSDATLLVALASDNRVFISRDGGATFGAAEVLPYANVDGLSTDPIGYLDIDVAGTLHLASRARLYRRPL